MHSGVFVYYVEVEFENDETIKRADDVKLIRKNRKQKSETCNGNHIHVY